MIDWNAKWNHVQEHHVLHYLETNENYMKVIKTQDTMLLIIFIVLITSFQFYFLN